MSKKSQREARERKEQSEQERLLRFSTTLKGYLSTCAQVFRQEITDEMVAAYQIALRRLSPERLKFAFEDCFATCKFFPRPAELLDAAEKMPGAGTQLKYPEVKPPTPAEKAKLDAEWKDCWDKITRTGRYATLRPPVTAKNYKAREPGEDE